MEKFLETQCKKELFYGKYYNDMYLIRLRLGLGLILRLGLGLVLVVKCIFFLFFVGFFSFFLNSVISSLTKVA